MTTGTILVVNMNHEQRDGESPFNIAAAVRAISGLPATIARFTETTPSLVRALSPYGIILSGQCEPWDTYDISSLSGIEHVVRDANVPLLGICGGHQFLALAFGGRVDLIRGVRTQKSYGGCFRESGFVSIEVLEDDPLLGTAGSTLMAYQSHCDELKDIPDNFIQTARGKTSNIQAIRHRDKPLYGVQFHPEKWSVRHPEGRQVLGNFLKLCTG